MQEAKLWRSIGGEGRIQCRLCSHFCVISPGEKGHCGVRINEQGVLHTLVGDRVAAVNLDPVEKKPLYHFLPGTMTLSLGTMGCNLSCSFCQNYSLSQPPREGGSVEGRRVSPQRIVEEALSLGAASIAYTYSEPTVFFELMLETATQAVRHGLKNIIVSNGFQSPDCLEALAPVIHAANIDLKAFTSEFYEEQCGARLEPVLENLRAIRSMGWWLEVTTLVIPGLNDSPEEARHIATFLADDLGGGVPWHISRFHPTHRLTDRPPTPVQSLEAMAEAGREAGVRHIYVGNVPGHAGGNTVCPGCGRTVVRRSGFRVTAADGPTCAACGEAVEGVGWEAFA